MGSWIDFKTSPVSAITVAVVSVLFSFCLNLSANSVLGNGPPILWYLPAILITSFAAGLFPGLVSVALSTSAIFYQLFFSSGTFLVSSLNDQVRLGVFIAIASLIVIMMDQLHRSIARAKSAHRSMNHLCQKLILEIEHRKSVEEKLKIKDQELDTILSSLPAAVLAINRDFKYEYCNNTFAQWSGHSVDQIIGSSISDIVGTEYFDQLKWRYEDVFSGAKHSFEEHLRFPDKWRYVHVDMVPIWDSKGKFSRCITMKYDVTAHVELERELIQAKLTADEALRAKALFVANMSHEIRTPLSAVIGFSHLLADANVKEAQKGIWAEAIERNGEVLDTIINDILDFSKIDAGKMPLDIAKTSLAEIIEDIVTAMNLKARAKGITLMVQRFGQLPVEIVTDKIRLKQILLNVVGNAIKFSDGGSIVLQISLSRSSANGQQLLFRIKDSGCGICAEDARRLFIPFSQVGHSGKAKYCGTGLGLSLSKALAERLGGNLILESSSVGEGSVFLLTIDPGMGQAPQLNTAPDLKIAKPAKTFQSNEDVFAGLSVLVVEDCVDLQVLMSHYLKQYGAEFCIAENGVAALNCLKDHSFDLILMDIQMPVMDGYQCTHKLRESGYNGRIFALTAHATEDEKIRVLRSGFDAYFSKPLDWSDLSNTIRQSASNGDSGHNSLPSVLIPRRRSALSNGMSGKPITLL